MFDDPTANSDSEEELLEAKQQAMGRLRVWRRRSIYSVIALFFSCASVTPFLYGHSLHSYWDGFGKYLVLLSMGLLPVAVYCTGLFWGSWLSLRDVEKGNL